MSFRELMNRNPAIAVTGAALVIVLAIAFMVYQSGSGPSSQSAAWYTTDDGASWYKDDIRKAPPYEKDGKQAVLVRLYQCADGKPFVAYLERLSPEAKAAVEKLNNGEKKPITSEEYAALGATIQNGVEVKKAGQKQWLRVASNNPQIQMIMSVQCARPGESPELVAP